MLLSAIVDIIIIYHRLTTRLDGVVITRVWPEQHDNDEVIAAGGSSSTKHYIQQGFLEKVKWVANCE